MEEFLAILIFSVLDQSNLFVSFASAPFMIGACVCDPPTSGRADGSRAYMTMIISFAWVGVALNSARDIGGEFLDRCRGRGVLTSD